MALDFPSSPVIGVPYSVGDNLWRWDGIRWIKVGSTGYQGSSGNAGYQGSLGGSGPVGYRGSLGSRGDTGYQGSLGSSGFGGSQGYTGSRGIYGGVSLNYTVTIRSYNNTPPKKYLIFEPSAPLLSISAYADDGTANGKDISAFLDSLYNSELSTLRAYITVSSQSDPYNYSIYSLNGNKSTGLDAYGDLYYRLDVTLISGSGPFPVDTKLTLSFSKNGPVGYIGSRGFNGYGGSKGDIGYTGSIGARYQATSTNTITIATGDLYMFVQPGLSYSTGQPVSIAYNSIQYMIGNVGLYDPITGRFVVNITNTVGAGTYTPWSVNIAGKVGDRGYGGSAGINYAGSIGVTGYRGSLGTTGATGATGDTGYRGSLGTTGATGATGATGFQGSLSATGYRGSLGTTGDRGSVGYYGSTGQYNQTFSVAVSDEVTTLITGTSVVSIRAPFALNLTSLPRASLSTASSSGAVTVDINVGGVSILGANKLSIDQAEKTSVTAATATTLATTSIADDAEITYDIDAAGIGAKGLKVTLYFVRP